MCVLSTVSRPSYLDSNMFSGWFLVCLWWGLYVFKLNVDKDWGMDMLLYDLGFIGFGLALELAGLRLIVLGKK